MGSSFRRYCASRPRNPVEQDDPAAVVDADLLDEQPEEFLSLLGLLALEDLFELADELGVVGYATSASTARFVTLGCAVICWLAPSPRLVSLTSPCMEAEPAKLRAS